MTGPPPERDAPPSWQGSGGAVEFPDWAAGSGKITGTEGNWIDQTNIRNKVIELEEILVSREITWNDR